MDLIGAYPSPFITTSAVADEITYRGQKSRYKAAVSSGYIDEQRFDDPSELNEYARLDGLSDGRLGSGELSIIAVAVKRNYRMAMEDRRAIKTVMKQYGITENSGRILLTQDIIVELIRKKILTLEEAEVIRTDWEINRIFTLNISSFEELL